MGWQGEKERWQGSRVHISKWFRQEGVSGLWWREERASKVIVGAYRRWALLDWLSMGRQRASAALAAEPATVHCTPNAPRPYDRTNESASALLNHKDSMHGAALLAPSCQLLPASMPCPHHWLGAIAYVPVAKLVAPPEHSVLCA